MIISSLIKYHEIMVERGEVLPEGYSSIEINYLVSLTPNGQIDGIISLGELDGKRRIYPKALVPERTQKPGIEANILEHRPLYIFGLANDKGVLTSTDNKATKSHNAFVDKNLQFFEGINSPIAKAYVEFVKSWQPDENCDNPYLVSIIKDYDKSRYAFCLSGQPEMTLHDDQLVKEHWQEYYSNSKNNEKIKLLLAQFLVSSYQLLKYTIQLKVSKVDKLLVVSWCALTTHQKILTAKNKAIIVTYRN